MGLRNRKKFDNRAPLSPSASAWWIATDQYLTLFANVSRMARRFRILTLPPSWILGLNAHLDNMGMPTVCASAPAATASPTPASADRPRSTKDRRSVSRREVGARLARDHTAAMALKSGIAALANPSHCSEPSSMRPLRIFSRTAPWLRSYRSGCAARNASCSAWPCVARPST